MTDISQFYFVSPYPFEASSHAGFPFSVNHLPCFCDNYIIFAPFCQQESTGFRVKYPIRFLCNFTTRILCTIFSLSSWYNFCKHFPCEKRFPQFYPLFHIHPCGKRWKRAGFVWCFLRQYRTKIVRQMRRQIFRQMKQKCAGRYETGSEGKFASRWRTKSPDALCAVLPYVLWFMIIE